MSIELTNMALTIVSIVVTIVSVVCSILASNSAKDARQYKEETLQLRDTFDLERLLSRFQVESKYFQNNTRKRDWYKGIDVNLVISPFSDVLSDFGNVYHLVGDSKGLKEKVHSLNEIIQTYDSANSSQRQETIKLIVGIIDILQHEVHNNTKQIVKN